MRNLEESFVVLPSGEGLAGPRGGQASALGASRTEEKPPPPPEKGLTADRCNPWPPIASLQGPPPSR